jgi:hypothetical protein
MNCRIFKNVVIPLADNRLMDAVIRQHGLLHSEVCPQCALRLSEERALAAGVRAAAAEIALQQAPAHLESGLLKAFRQQQVELAKQATGRRTSWSGFPLRALAAGVLLLLSLLAGLWLQQSWLKRQQLARAAIPATPAAPDAPAPGSLPADSVIVQKVNLQAGGPQRRPRRYRAAVRSPEVELVTEFYPLLEGDNLEEMESGQIVRVELSGAAILAAGLPLDAALADEPIKADVILGHDGQARAIRFVR